MALTDSLISYWKLDEASGNALDAHGANELTETSGTVASATGIISNARDFETADSECFQRADNTDLSTGDIDFSFSCWVKLESKAGTYAVIGKWNFGASQREYNLQYVSASDRFVWAVSNNGTASTSATANNLGSPSTATWYHIAVWHDATANEIGIAVNDGTPDTASHTTGVFNGTSAFVIGGLDATPNNPFDGLIDEVGFWKRVLTSAEITGLYNAGAGLSYDDFDAAPTTNRRRRVLIAGAR